MKVPGVYLELPGGELRLVHEYCDDTDYVLEHITETFATGHAAPPPVGADAALEFDARALRELKVQADAHSFDAGPEFIEMCNAVAAQQPPARGVLKFVSILDD